MKETPYQKAVLIKDAHDEVDSMTKKAVLTLALKMAILWEDKYLANIRDGKGMHMAAQRAKSQRLIERYGELL